MPLYTRTQVSVVSDSNGETCICHGLGDEAMPCASFLKTPLSRVSVLEQIRNLPLRRELNIADRGAPKEMCRWSLEMGERALESWVTRRDLSQETGFV